jgi:hypothetical protein
MDRKIFKEIEHNFPYPIISDLRLLFTVEYIGQDDRRLKQLLKSSESIIQFLSLIALSDYVENISKDKLIANDAFKKEFQKNIPRSCFGKMIALFRDIVRIFKQSEHEMFIPEMPDFFIKGKSSESESQKSFNLLSAIRNKLTHKDFNPTKRDIENLCIECENHVETILKNLAFFKNYHLLYVNNVIVKHIRWNAPNYTHIFSEISGDSSKFDAYPKVLDSFVNSPAVILTKENENNYLDLSPLIIYSEEGEARIPDIFMYSDFEEDKYIKYSPVWQGGSFKIKGTTYEKEIMKSFNNLISYVYNSK